jgi:hypothetical protein
MIRYLSKRVMLLIAGLVFMIPLLSRPLMAKIDVENRAWRPHRAGGAVNHRPNHAAEADPEPCMEQDSLVGE